MTDANSFSPLTKVTGETTKGILKPHDNDVLFGRGGNINVHPGNEEFRRIVHRYKGFYSAARYKKEKRLIADEILAVIEKLNPPGRFLAKDSSTGLWHTVGYEKARNKASQALRENGSLLKSNALKENEALHAELKKYNEQEARQFAEQYDALHHGYQTSFKEYHNENTMPPVHRNTIPPVHRKDSVHRKENVNSSDIHTCNELIYNTLPYHNTVTECQLTEGNQNHENKIYSIERIKDDKELSCHVRSPKIKYDSKTVVWNDKPENTKKSWDLTRTNMEPFLNSNRIMSPSNGEDSKGVTPVVIDSKDRQSNMMENRVWESEVFNSRERLISRGELTLQSIEIDDSDTIGGQSLVNVFDGDSMRNREISDISMLSLDL